MTMVHISFGWFILKLYISTLNFYDYPPGNAYVLFKTKKVLYVPKRKNTVMKTQDKTI